MGMGSKEFDEQKAGGQRYFLDSVPEEDGFGFRVVDRETGEEVGRDGGEPEDQLLVRDWRWVPEALNKAAAAERLAISEALEEMRGSEAYAPPLNEHAIGFKAGYLKAVQDFADLLRKRGQP